MHPMESIVDELLQRCRLVFESSFLLEQLDNKKDSAHISSLVGSGTCCVLLTCADPRFTVLLKTFRFSMSSQLGNVSVIPRYGYQLGFNCSAFFPSIIQFSLVGDKLPKHIFVVPLEEDFVAANRLVLASSPHEYDVCIQHHVHGGLQKHRPREQVPQRSTSKTNPRTS